jgi:hypothetical protein
LFIFLRVVCKTCKWSDDGVNRIWGGAEQDAIGRQLSSDQDALDDSYLYREGQRCVLARCLRTQYPGMDEAAMGMGWAEAGCRIFAFR